jgi:phosphoribosyl 1,2-cyclic phosphodiesterase
LIGKAVELFHSGSEFALGGFKIYPFSVSHDALEPVAFTVQINDKTIGLATDLGHLNNLVKYKLSNCNLLVLEANHDTEMLMKSERSINLKRRIKGRFGHLNNEDAMNALSDILHEKTKYIIFYHLSSDCNSQEIVIDLAKDKIKSLMRNDITFSIAEQNTALNTIWL